MSNNINLQNKETWKDAEITLADLGFSLEKIQPFTIGEKKFIQSVTTKSGKKFILLGRRISDKKRVIIKITKDKEGSEEIEHEHVCRRELQKMDFSYKIFLSPEEILFTKRNGYTISIQEYIEQKSPFLELTPEEQFSLILKDLKIQEGAHATTYKHRKKIEKTFGYVDSLWYLKSFEEFQNKINQYLPENDHLNNLLRKGDKILKENVEIIEQYCDFLTHTDFVPHNFRVKDGRLYILDHSSIRFGNKYEGWARLLNFMTLYNKTLEDALIFYVQNNKTKEEYESLKLMRIYRLGEIIWYYTNILSKTSGDLHKLTDARIKFWTAVLEAILKNSTVSEKTVDEYKKTRDSLRSEEEKLRQKNLF